MAKAKTQTADTIAITLTTDELGLIRSALYKSRRRLAGMLANAPLTPEKMESVQESLSGLKGLTTKLRTAGGDQ